MKKLLIFLVFTFYIFAETYTIGNQGQYPNLKLFLDAVNNGTITGNIEAKITSDLTETYNLEFKKSGTGNVNYNSIFIYPDKPVTIDLGSNNIYLNGAENIVISGKINNTGNNLTIKSSSYNFNVEIRNSAKNIKIENCNFINTSTGSSGSIIISCKDKYNSSTNLGIISNISINDNNFIKSGGPAIKLEGYDKNSRVKTIKIENNKISDFLSYGIQTANIDSIKINNNYIFTTTKMSSGLWGIIINNYWDNLIISNNRIYTFQLNNDYAQIYGISISSYNSEDFTNKAVVFNNVISLDKSITNAKLPIYGIYTSSNNSKIEIVYNTIYIGGKNVTASSYNSSYGIYKDGANLNYILKNNIIINDRSNGNTSVKHYAAIFKNNGGITQNSVDYNLYSVNGIGGYLINYNSQDCSDLNDYLSKNSIFDQHSVSKVLNFYGNNDYNLYIDSISLKDTLTLKAEKYLKSVIDTNIKFDKDILGYDRTYYCIKGAYNDTSVIKIITSLENQIINNKNLQLYQNYPNPFNPTTFIKFYLPEKEKIKLDIYNSNGQLVNTLFYGVLEQGYHNIKFNALNMSSGIYFYTLTSSKYKLTKKMLLLK